MTGIDHEYTPEIVCPWCGYEHGDSWEFDDEGTQECYGCDKKFSYYRHIEVTYTSSKEEEND